MRSKKILLTSFSRVLKSKSFCIRPDNENELTNPDVPLKTLARGAGLSYNDSCLNQEGFIVDTTRLNHLIQFNSDTGVAVCQGGVTFKELFLLHPEFIPPVIPGTVHATVAGGIAHDVHGKNNHQEGSFGHHLLWFELILNGKIIHCSPKKHSDLFHATIAGSGLTGMITRASIRLKKASRFVHVDNKKYDSLTNLLEDMSTLGLNYDYQVAWLDLLNIPSRALLSLAKHCEPVPSQEKRTWGIPQLPLRLINSWNMKLFNKLFFKKKKTNQILSLEQFNNPLDKIKNWNQLYGPKGLIQFQAVFNQENAITTLNHLLHLINFHKATPTLAVLKLFTKSGNGLLSFCKPGFTLAIDFINNEQAHKAISTMNQFITEINGHIYLAKDLLLNANQFNRMYPERKEWVNVLERYQCTSCSDMSRRLEITK